QNIATATTANIKRPIKTARRLRFMNKFLIGRPARSAVRPDGPDLPWPGLQLHELYRVPRRRPELRSAGICRCGSQCQLGEALLQPEAETSLTGFLRVFQTPDSVIVSAQWRDQN